ncbi:hypothetical protein OHS70_37735 [Streptomyces sp. NBC_00390]|uniref:hypothetical protein n=1 Tax=Streptomyces sp. NBC_00390 TaxID=2975736 RepID=UPI002E1A7F38
MSSSRPRCGPPVCPRAQDLIRANLEEQAARWSEADRDEAYRRLLLLASDDLYRWLKDAYLPAEHLVRQTYVRQLRGGLEVDEQALAARRAFNTMLRDDLVDLARPEIHKLREPLA